MVKKRSNSVEDTLNIQSLFKRIANDDQRAFQLFFDYTYMRLYRYVSYFLANKEEYDDVLSDIYLNLWQNRKKLPQIKDHENYLFVCVRNLALKYKNEVEKFQKIRLEDADIFGLSEGTTPEQDILNQELRAIIELIINSLPRRCRLIFFMVREESMTYKEVARVLSISERTVHAQMCSAIKRIGTAIQEYYNR